MKRFHWILGGRNDAIGTAPNPKTQICSKPKNHRVRCYLLLCLVAKRWVCVVGFDLLLIDGGGGFDYENAKFAGYSCSCFGFDCETVKFDSGFALVLFDMHCWIL